MDSMQLTTVSAESGILTEQFWTAVDIWYKNPHYVCRRLCGSIILNSVCLTWSHGINKLISNVNKLDLSTTLSNDVIRDKLTRSIDQEVIASVDYLVIVSRLIPRNSNKHLPSRELIILDKCNNIAVFIPLDKPEDGLSYVSMPYSYCIHLIGEEMQLSLINTENIHPSIINLETNWLKSILFTKLVKWAKLANPVCSEKVVRSLSHVSVDSYIIRYEELKNKYGKHMVGIWPEKTDPAKFVYEDIAIAVYLLLLWDKQREEMGRPEWKQSFVDLGCGNGLLVYILSSEGHRGVGLDVRKRGIWNLYPETTKLEVKAINPINSCIFQDYDWLIGNHSDELTPWIPVFANRSTYNCSFFLLPCCFYDFGGNKYQRKDTGLSQYSDYLNYVHHICDTCGFDTKVDKLRIPSTKRTCFIGSRRTYSLSNSEMVELSIKGMISAGCGGNTEFKPRDGEEKVRNCTQLKKGVVEEVLKIVINQLLNNPVPNEKLDGKSKWNSGRKISLKDLANAIPNETLLEMKSECGGLQTLLRNKRHIFVVAEGIVYLRDPTVTATEKKQGILKNLKSWKSKSISETNQKRRCWFHDSHPDGCPLSAHECFAEH